MILFLKMILSQKQPGLRFAEHSPLSVARVLGKARITRKMIFLLFAFLLCGCLLKTKSGNAAFNRNIAITALSGNAYIHISGRISEDIYLNHSGEERAWDKNIIETPIVVQGTETIDQHILLYESQEFKYTLTIAEVVIMNIRSIDGNDVRLLVQEYGKNKEYTISGKNKQGKMISFKN